MGEYVGLTIGNHDFLSWKNSFGGLLLIFSEEDLKIENCMCDDEPYQRRYFSTTIFKAKKCLDCLGYTLLEARKDFEKSKEEELEFIDYRIETDAEYESEYQKIKEEFTFEKWEKAVKKYARILYNDSYDSTINDYKKIYKERKKKLSVAEQIVIDTLPFPDSDKFFGLYGDEICVWNIFRVILEAFSDEEIIELDYTNLFDGGWCDEKPTDEDLAVPKTIILTEGKFDVEVLSKSMKLLYPYMTKFFSFINFSEYHVQGSTNFLTHYLRAFIASGIQNRVIAIYDNDSAGRAEILSLSEISIPENFRIMTLPDIKLANNYPTLGPNGKDLLNINGKACSIELYLGKDVLKDNDDFIPVHWKGYNEKTKTYQGEVMNKSIIQERFRKKVLLASDKNEETYDWEPMRLLLENIFSAFSKEQ